MLLAFSRGPKALHFLCQGPALLSRFCLSQKMVLSLFSLHRVLFWHDCPRTHGEPCAQRSHTSSVIFNSKPISRNTLRSFSSKVFRSVSFTNSRERISTFNQQSNHFAHFRIIWRLFHSVSVKFTHHAPSSQISIVDLINVIAAPYSSAYLVSPCTFLILVSKSSTVPIQHPA